MMDRVLFVGGFGEYDKLAMLNTKQFECIHFNPKYHLFFEKRMGAFFKRMFKLFPMSLKETVYQSMIKRRIKINKPKLVVFKDEGIYLKVLLDDSFDSQNLILVRNPIKNNTSLLNKIIKAKSKGIRVVSFDEQDCLKYGFSYKEQFITVPSSNLEYTPIEYDFTFIGREKDRGNQLKSLKKLFDTLNLANNFIVLNEGDNSKDLTYEEYLEESLKGNCVVDIMQLGQSGLTLRPLESAIYNRKLLTDYPDIVNHPFYNENNIMIYQGVNLDIAILEEFLQKPMVDVSELVLQNYTLDSLLLYCADFWND